MRRFKTLLNRRTRVTVWGGHLCKVQQYNTAVQYSSTVQQYRAVQYLGAAARVAEDGGAGGLLVRLHPAEALGGGAPQLRQPGQQQPHPPLE